MAAWEELAIPRATDPRFYAHYITAAHDPRIATLAALGRLSTLGSAWADVADAEEIEYDPPYRVGPGGIAGRVQHARELARLVAREGDTLVVLCCGSCFLVSEEEVEQAETFGGFAGPGAAFRSPSHRIRAENPARHVRSYLLEAQRLLDARDDPPKVAAAVGVALARFQAQGYAYPGTPCGAADVVRLCARAAVDGDGDPCTEWAALVQLREGHPRAYVLVNNLVEPAELRDGFTAFTPAVMRALGAVAGKGLDNYRYDCLGPLVTYAGPAV